MTNPLIDKYEEIYGEKKEEVIEEKEVVEEKKSPLSIKEMKERYTSSGLLGGMGDDHIIFGGGGTDTINLNPYPSFNTPTLISTTPNTFLLPQNTEMDKQLCKVMDDVAKGKAVMSSISAEVDKSFTGFGGQIRYSIEIVGTYP